MIREDVGKSESEGVGKDLNYVRSPNAGGLMVAGHDVMPGLHFGKLVNLYLKCIDYLLLTANVT